MKNTLFSSYEIIFNALLVDGYSEEEAEQLICDVIEDQIEMDNIARNIHNIIKNITYSSSILSNIPACL